MDKVMHMVVFGALAVAVLAQVTTAQTVHMVGDNFGWSVPINGAAAYAKWAGANTIKVGDTLVFKFTEGKHDVQEVSKSSFEECNTKNAIGEAIKTGPANVTIKTAGDHYYICTVGQHCLGGQKISIKVSATTAANSPATNSPAANSPATNSPAANSPAPSTPPPPSSSTVVFASFLLSLSSIALTIFL